MDLRLTVDRWHILDQSWILTYGSWLPDAAQWKLGPRLLDAPTAVQVHLSSGGAINREQ